MGDSCLGVVSTATPTWKASLTPALRNSAGSWLLARVGDCDLWNSVSFILNSACSATNSPSTPSRLYESHQIKPSFCYFTYKSTLHHRQHGSHQGGKLIPPRNPAIRGRNHEEAPPSPDIPPTAFAECILMLGQ
jgi:hypothetical protein